jgi:hypothetical protein
MSQIPGAIGGDNMYGENLSHMPHSDQRIDNRSIAVDDMEMTSDFRGITGLDEFMNPEGLAFLENFPDGVDFSALSDGYGILPHNEPLLVPEVEATTYVPQSSKRSAADLTMAQLTEHYVRGFGLENCDPKARFSSLASGIFDRGLPAPSLLQIALLGFEKSNIAKTVEIVTWWLQTECLAYAKQYVQRPPQALEKANLGYLIQMEGNEWFENAPIGVLFVVGWLVLRAARAHLREMSTTRPEISGPSWSQVCGEWAKSRHSKA